MKIIPEIRLPEDLQLNADPDVHEFIENCISGIKYITVHRKEKRSKYEPISKIELQDKPSVTQRPSEKIEDICSLIMAIIQYDLEARDESGVYRIMCYRNAGTSKDAVKSKHVTVKLDEGNIHSHDHSLDPFDNDESPNFTSLQLEYIKMLQDQNIKNQSIVSTITSTFTENFKNMQNMVNDLMQKNVDIERLRAQERILEREAMLDAQIEKVKAEKSAEKWNKTADLLAKSGAAKKLVEVFVEKLKGKVMDESPELPDEDLMPPPPPSRKKPSSSRPVVVRPRPTPFVEVPIEMQTDNSDEQLMEQPEVIDPPSEEIDEQTLREIDEMIEAQPLRTRANILGATLDEHQRKSLREILGNDLYGALDILFQSGSEEEAIENLIGVQKTLNIPKDINKLKKAKTILNEKQQGWVEEILSFNLEK